MAVVFLLAFGLRAWAVVAHPLVHGEDSIARLAHADTLVLAYQLPLPQAVVVAVRHVAPDPRWTRLAFAAIGAAAAAALAELVAASAGAAAGLAAGVLAAAHPLLVYYSVVPYQEGPTLLLLALGARASLLGRERSASAALGLAALCRYEAWIANAMAAAAAAWRARPSGARAVVRAVLLFAWAPLAWIVVWRGLSPAGTYVLDLDLAASRGARLLFLATKLREYSGLPFLALAAAGLAVAAGRRVRGAGWAAAFVAAVMTAVVLFGHESPPGSGRVSERLAHIPAFALCAAAGIALAALAGLPPRRIGRAVAVLATAVFVLSSVATTERLLDAAGRDPSLRLAGAVARFAATRLPLDGRLGVAAPPVPRQALDDYVRKVAGAGGDTARARQIAEALATTRPDADRIAAHLPRPPGTVVTAPGGRAPDLVAVFDDAPRPVPWPLGEAVARFGEGPRAVTVYRTAPAGSSGAGTE